MHITTNMTTKICTKCKNEKNINDFGFRSVKEQTRLAQCKQCRSVHMKKYFVENKETILEKHIQYHSKNIEADNKRQHEWYVNGGKDIVKHYKQINREKFNTYERTKYKTDPQYRMKKILRSRFKKTIDRKKIYKSVLEYIDIDLELFLKWIEFQFDENMSWENSGKYWDIDHVNPCDNFDLTNEDDVKKCFHWTNLRPLEKTENGTKGNIYDKHIIKEHKKVAEKFKVYLSENKSSTEIVTFV